MHLPKKLGSRQQDGWGGKLTETWSHCDPEPPSKAARVSTVTEGRPACFQAGGLTGKSLLCSGVSNTVSCPGCRVAGAHGHLDRHARLHEREEVEEEEVKEMSGPKFKDKRLTSECRMPQPEWPSARHVGCTRGR